MKNLEILLENALDAVVGANNQEQIIYWNSQAEKIFGWSKAEALGQDMANLIIPPVHRDAHRQGMKHYLSTGIGPILNLRIEVPALRRDGTEFPCELTVTPIKNNKETNFFSFIRDVTEQKKIELEKTSLLKASESAVRARDEFLAVCSHELKTPLTSLLLQYELTTNKIKKGDQEILAPQTTLARMEKSRAQLKRLVSLIDDMLDVSRIQVGKLHLTHSPFNVFELIKELAGRFENEEGVKHIYLTCERPETAIIQGDKNRMEQVFLNLLTNSFKYGDGKEIKIRVTRGLSDLEVSFTDHGKGIEPENLSRIFEKFERGAPDSNVNGMGLGLFITRSIVEAHQGKITVESQLNMGSTFRVFLPVG